MPSPKPPRDPSRPGWNAPQTIGQGPHNLPGYRSRQAPIPTNLVVKPDEWAARSRAARAARAGAAGNDVFRVFDQHRYAEIIELNFTADVASALFLQESNGLRNFLAIRNSSTGGQILFIGFGQQATLGSWLRIEPDQIVLFDTVVPQNDLYAITDVAGATFSIGYSIIPAT